VRDDINDRTLLRIIKPKTRFDPSWFTKRELVIMERLVFYFQETKANDMTDVSHARDMPWGKIYDDGKGKGHLIPYELSLQSDTLIKDMPTLSDEEYRYRSEVFGDITS
jgi:hypothetical protein